MEQLDRVEHRIVTVERLISGQAETLNQLLKLQTNHMAHVTADITEIHEHLEQIDATVNKVRVAEKIATLAAKRWKLIVTAVLIGLSAAGVDAKWSIL